MYISKLSIGDDKKYLSCKVISGKDKECLECKEGYYLPASIQDKTKCSK